MLLFVRYEYTGHVLVILIRATVSNDGFFAYFLRAKPGHIGTELAVFAYVHTVHTSMCGPSSAVITCFISVACSFHLPLVADTSHIVPSLVPSILTPPDSIQLVSAIAAQSM